MPNSGLAVLGSVDFMVCGSRRMEEFTKSHIITCVILDFMRMSPLFHVDGDMFSAKNTAGRCMMP